MSKQPFLPLFFGDFLASTAEWEGEERALYLLLMGYQWSLESLPTDPRRVCKLVGFDPELFDRCWPVVSRKFVERDGRLVNQRLETHREKSVQIAEKRAVAGAKGASARLANIKQLPDIGQAIAKTLLSHPSHPIPFQSKSSPESSSPDRAQVANLAGASERASGEAKGSTPKISEATRTCLLLRDAGLGLSCANPTHPGLLAALAAGATPEAILATAQEFPDKPLGYWLRTLDGRRSDSERKPNGATVQQPAITWRPPPDDDQPEAAA